jgi:hypothetical protein
MRVQTAITLLALSAATAALASDTLIRAGRWEMTAEMDFGRKDLPKGAPLSKPMVSIACITAEEASQGKTPLLKPELPEPGCKISGYSQTGTSVRYTLVCEEMTSTFEATVHSPERYSGKSVTVSKDDASRKMIMKFEGRRTGDRCSASELADDAED